MLVRITKSKWYKRVTLLLALSLVTQVFYPTAAYALTSGPSQPEVQSFTPVGVSDMVDLFSGDFHYNIPLLDVGGYPINMSYASGITMDQEASWVGLGWNLNTGCITRNMRGLPDDFDGDLVVKEANMKKNITFGLTTGIGLEALGKEDLFGLSASLGINYNNYNGIGFESSVSPTLSLSKLGAGPFNLALGLSASADGLDIRPSLSYSKLLKDKEQNDKSFGSSIGVNINSRAGLTATTVNTSLSNAKDKTGDGDFDDDGEITDGKNAGGHISFAAQTYVPSYEMPRNNYSVTVSAKLGPTIVGVDGVEATLSGYYNESGLAQKSESLPSYGYFNSGNEVNYSKILMDFNREKDGGFSRATTNLPVTNSTYDVFSIAGQGIGGSFRGFRGDVGYVFDPSSQSTSVGASLGGELAAGQLVSGGLDVNVNTNISRTSKWNSYNSALNSVSYQPQTPGSTYEQVYLKELGEKSVDGDGLYNNLGGDHAVRYTLTPYGYDANLNQQFSNTFGSLSSVPSSLKRSERAKRNNCISVLKKSEVNHYGLTGYAAPDAKLHHIGEITVLRNDGARYVYGLPAYNKFQQEMTFSVVANGDCGTGLVTYTNTEASNANSSGLEHYYQMTKTPAYAHSFMLTDIVSPDYVDIDGIRGPSEGDLGSYTHFDYDASTSSPGIQATKTNYKWRTPYSTAGNQAYFNEGLKSKTDDQKGSVVYGEKELFYIQRISTKTHIAVFYSSPRADAYDVAGISGGLGTNSMYKLDSIALYSLPDYKANDDNAEAIKKVHFRYDYSLCPDVPNNNNAYVDEKGDDEGENINAGHGKLTLKKIFFTYGKSRKGKIHAYSFNYADVDHNGTVDDDENPEYNVKGYDRWGNYKPNSGGCNLAEDLPAAECPYVEEDVAEGTRNKWAAAWSLTSIKVPAGGTMKIHYESDDYAYVQDQEAGQMFKILGTSSGVPTSSTTLTDKLYQGSTLYNYLVFDLPYAIPSESEAELTARYIKKLYATGLVYFRFLVALNSIKTDGQCDYVSGYAEIDEYGFVSGTSGGRAWIKLKEVKEDGGASADANPISKAAWQFARMHNPKLAYSQFAGTNPTGGILSVLNALASGGLINQIINLVEGPNGDLQNRDCGRLFAQEKSWIRLYNPDGQKHGGGSRVKKIEIVDNWENMTGGSGTSHYENASYGQEFSYNDPVTGTSYGVASYEPQMGGDENVFRKPVYMTTKHLLAPDDISYLEEPFGESYFPSPSVGYSRVTVTDIKPEGITTAETGKTVSEFYTAKDFPTYTERTGILPHEKKSGLLGTLIKLDVKNYMTATQGYLIELNDMHGKQKAQAVYQAGKNEPISKVEYKYATKTLSHALPVGSVSLTRTVLDNNVATITSGNDVVYSDVGKEYEFTVDMRESVNEVAGFTTQGNLAVFLALVVPIPVPTIFPGFNREKTVFRSAVNTKVINRYGVLKETIAYDLGSKVSTENLAYDAQTGEVLLTKTINNFDDPIYNFTYPAHWAYEGMGQAYQNIGFKVVKNISPGGSASVSNGYISQSSGQEYLVPGDEVAISNAPGFSGSSSILGTTAWVWDDDDDHTDVYLIDKNGALLPNASNVLLKVMRSGHRNMQTLPMGAVTLMDNPLEDTDVVPDGLYDRVNLVPSVGRDVRILQASATEFSENWGTYCDIEGNIANSTDACNCEENIAVTDFMTLVLNTMVANFDNNPTGTVGIPPDQDDIVMELLNRDEDDEILYYNDFATDDASVPLRFQITGSGQPICTATVSLVSPASFPGDLTWEDLTGVQYVGGSLPPTCSTSVDVNDVYYLGTFTGGETILFKVNWPCVDFYNCDPPAECEPLVDKTVNPYRHNIRGNYRPQKQWLPLVDRVQENYTSSANNHLKIRNEGQFEDFSEFWKLESGDAFWTAHTTDWTWSNEVTKFDPYGNEIENRDALDRKSGAVYGYNNKLAIAVAANARFKDIAFDGFEDYDYKVISECCKDHFDFYAHKTSLTQNAAHSGRYSMSIAAEGEISTTYALKTAATLGGADNVPYTVKEKDILGYFSPDITDADQRFVLSYWVKSANPTFAELHDYDDVTASLTLDAGTVTIESTKKTNVIDGWQQVEIVFVIPKYSVSAASEITLAFANATGAETAYVDDIRLHPFNSSMKSFVYDPITLRLWAELDERNFATFYQYDQEGALIRVKKETERGIMTIQESRNNTQKEAKDKL